MLVNSKFIVSFPLIAIIFLSGCVSQNNSNTTQSSSVTDECDNMNDYGSRVLCYYNLATAKNDSSICQKIELQDRKNMCIALADKDASFCRIVENDLEKTTCYSDVASAKKDPTVCQNIQSEFYRNLCIEKARG